MSELMKQGKLHRTVSICDDVYLDLNMTRKFTKTHSKFFNCLKLSFFRIKR